ncbi:MAG: hypothetical protein ACFWTJ_06480 [Lachnoclostridium sp.]|jgi:glycopeptide antibiotics resistance protein
MHRSYMNNATSVILFSILTILIQFGVYFFSDMVVLTFIVAAIICLIFTHILLEQSLSYDSCFSYSLLNIFLSTGIIVLFYFNRTDFSYPLKPEMAWFVIINWSIPLLYSIIRNLTDDSGKYRHFKIFYRNINLIFILFYIYFMTILLFLDNMNFVQTYASDIQANLAPLITIATVIEDYINGYLELKAMIRFFLVETLIFLPYGFYITLLFRYRGKLMRLMGFLFLPILVEILQYISGLGKVDIDDVILGLLGGFLGAILYYILNRIYFIFTDKDFLDERNNYTFDNNSYYF